MVVKEIKLKDRPLSNRDKKERVAEYKSKKLFGKDYYMKAKHSSKLLEDINSERNIYLRDGHIKVLKEALLNALDKNETDKTLAEEALSRL